MKERKSISSTVVVHSNNDVEDASSNFIQDKILTCTVLVVKFNLLFYGIKCIY